MGDMEENPYQSPREEGYDPPRQRIDPKIKDMMALLATGILIFALIMAIAQLIAWLSGAFSFRT